MIKNYFIKPIRKRFIDAFPKFKDETGQKIYFWEAWQQSPFFDSNLTEEDLLKLLDELDTKKIKFALSNVLYSKGKTNDLLIEWSKKYTVHHLDYTYQNCNYHTKDKTNKSDEVLITNY